jgi:hypothetical protein
MNVSEIVQLLDREKDRLTGQLRGVSQALVAFGKTYSERRPTKRLSAAARAKIAAAQRARWAKARHTEQTTVEKKMVPIRPKRAISPAGRRRIAAAQRARWAKMKRAKRAA